MNNNKNFFHYKKLKINLDSNVYEPAEDTFLLLESINLKPNDYVFEIGTGTGIIALACALNASNVICCDINPFAIKITKKNYLENKHLLKGLINIRQGNQFSVLKPNENFDVIIFNPPYLPTNPNEEIGGNGWFDKAVDGGSSGLEITNEFLEKLPKYLRKDGKAYFIYSSLSNIKLLKPFLEKFVSKIVKSISFDDETLHVYMVKLKK